ncbi:uncharacterized protein PHACADRAFT_25829 [Phanerochaete carnosa HHB-10118-sp]|uniref:Uncharacterized protein n=1 Tax=Phanerochaete carnosa (strain HHB-10118-sp) TaxID=650164 RepID=K5W719_PHACS|nr:uncharacterized protein PHACADRAFT_25829 [Phanerochaete carnosa HHB-10118-sp]EKM59743.1 hypothetical protein PHACADRAFT_25829 [Phanerochaete carnosa HHB-10118-sp]
MRFTTAFALLIAAAIPSVLALPAPAPAPQSIDRPVIEHEHPHLTVRYATSGFRKRQDGGNARSGNSGDVSGGDVINEGDGDGTITNDDSSTGGVGGTTSSGNAIGGAGYGFGNGGDAETGNAGDAFGGSVVNSGGNVDNTGGGSTGGTGGTSTSGTAVGGDAGNGYDDFNDYEGFD